MVQNTISITKAKNRISSITDEVAKTGGYYTLTDKGQPKAVILSFAEFGSWLETMSVKHNFSELDNDIQDARDDFANGHGVSLEEVLLKEKSLDK